MQYSRRHTSTLSYSVMEVIGAGFGRTGTHSLKLALEELNYKAFHTMEMLENSAVLEMWYDAIFSQSQAALGSPDFDMITAQGYTASTDLPVALYYETLVNKYPDAKFILTTRSTDEAWFVSWEHLVRYTSFVPRFVPWLPGVKKFDRYNRWLLSLFHADDTFLTVSHPFQQDPVKVMQAYNSHNARVREVIPTDRLLEFHPKHGWEPLCKFLGKPVPTAMAFPHSNTSGQVAYDMMKFVIIYNGILLIIFIGILLQLRMCTKRLMQGRRQRGAEKMHLQ